MVCHKVKKLKKFTFQQWVPLGCSENRFNFLEPELIHFRLNLYSRWVLMKQGPVPI